MMFRVFLVVSALAVLACGSSSIKLHQLESVAEVERLAHRSFKTFINFLGDALQGKNTETLFLESVEAMDITQLSELSSVNKFVFTNCAKPQDEVVVVNKATLKPDPLKLPGNVTAGGSVTIKKPVGTPLKVALTVHYKVLGAWIKVPCVDNVGSCTYDDVCKMLKVEKCPPAIVKAGLTCKCPFPAGNFTVASATLPIKAKVPVSGDIKVRAEASQNKAIVTCAEVQLKLA